MADQERVVRARIARSSSDEKAVRQVGLIPIRDPHSVAAMAKAEAKRARRAKRGW